MKYGYIGLGNLGPDAKGDCHTQTAERAAVKAMARHIRRDYLAAHVQRRISVHSKDGVPLHEVPDLPAQARQMDRRLI